VISVGVDMVEIERVESAVKRWRGRFLNRIYTEAELKICGNRISSLATRFAAKEAIMKVLGTGAKGVNWQEIEILADDAGKPIINLYGKAADKARGLNLSEFSVSLCDTRQYAIATAISA